MWILTDHCFVSVTSSSTTRGFLADLSDTICSDFYPIGLKFDLDNPRVPGQHAMNFLSDPTNSVRV